MKRTTILASATALLALPLFADKPGRKARLVEKIEVRYFDGPLNLGATDSRYHSGEALVKAGTRNRSVWSAILLDRQTGALELLHPQFSGGNPWGESTIYDHNETQQVGYAGGRGHRWAALWSGTADSYVTLHPWGHGRGLSEATAIDGDYQAGWAGLSRYGTHAGIWRGDRRSFQSLHPDHARSSRILSASSGWQGGYVEVSGPRSSHTKHAGAWRGEAETFLDLHPADANESGVLANHGADMVGWTTAEFRGLRQAARWWAGDGSYQSLHPTGADYSSANDIAGDYLVGSARIGGERKALLWLGERDSYVDLNSVLGAGVGSSAETIHRDGLQLIVGGHWHYASSPGTKWPLEWVITLRDTRAPVIIDAEPVETEGGDQSRHPDQMTITFDVAIEDDSNAVDWSVKGAWATFPGRDDEDDDDEKVDEDDENEDRNRKIIRKTGRYTVRVKTGDWRRRGQPTYTVLLQARDAAGRRSRLYRVSFQVDEH